MEPELKGGDARAYYESHIGERVFICVEAGGTSTRCFFGYLIDVQSDYLRLFRAASDTRRIPPFRPSGRIINLRGRRNPGIGKWARVMISIALDKIVSFTVYTPKAMSPEEVLGRRRPCRRCPPPPFLILALLILLLKRRQ